MIMAPLFAKYRAKSGRDYVYDSLTNEILHVGPVIYALIDDYGVLNQAEIFEKHRGLGEEAVLGALRQLEALQARGILRGHAPCATSPLNRLVCLDKEQSIEEFLHQMRRMLILQLTQDCNMHCEYCYLEENYSRVRGTASLSLDVARKAVRDFIDHRPSPCTITFYGGEPLLEFGLLQQIVFFAEEYGGRAGVEPRFSITTNGTLLSEKVIHFLVEHQFTVMISIDGPKEVHDRYRLMGSKRSQCKASSHDIIMRNIARFIDLYPDYQQRGLSITITATSSMEVLDEFFRKLQIHFPLINANFVAPLTSDFEEKRDDSLRKGHCHGGACGAACVGSPCIALGKGNGELIEEGFTPLQGKQQEIPEFVNWKDGCAYSGKSSPDHIVEELSRNPNVASIKDERPISFRNFRGEIKDIHRRAILPSPPQHCIPNRCYPGVFRTFCSARGVYHACEKTETSELFKLGDVEQGFDVKAAIRLLEACRLLGDCGNCVGGPFCSYCPAVVSENRNSGAANASAFQKRCHNHIRGLNRRLALYTTAMETNPNRVEECLPKGTPDVDWLKGLRHVPPEERLCDVDLGVEELELSCPT